MPVVVNRDVPAELKVQCTRRPPRPATFASDKAALDWALRWGWSGENCRALSDSQGDWLSHPPS